MTKKDAGLILSAIDALALSLPAGFRWPNGLRKQYETATNKLSAILRRN